MSCAAHSLAVSRRFLDWEDVDLIQELAKGLPAGARVADLGAGSGTTALSVFAVCPDIKVYTVDHSGEAIYWSGKAVENIGRYADWFPIHGDSISVIDKAKIYSPFDMLMIDTSHEYQETVDELSHWLPLVKPNGPVWLHDYRGEYPGVPKAVDEAVERGELKPYAIKGLGWGGFKNV